ncbi:YaaL family protein [Mycobacteroides abscessus]|uniref:YaaL family protein n=1 Tax=unclassified Desemzia TaxID=2685243 RepID=UPI0009A8956B|nr:Protein of uncharacterised function (DUF2508) [Mycobacteroides abscessus subsp. abscessus]
MGWKKKYRLRKEYDDSLLLLMKKLREDWEMSKRIERSSIEKDGQLFAQTKLAEAKYFYLFKEARERKIKGDLTGKY